jgi:tRNA(Ile)-lysidine synthase TilS/MesJ
MECDHCRREAILFQPYSGQHLCDRHLTLDVERRAKRAIRKNGWITPGDRIAIVVDGDARGIALLHFLVAVFGKRRDLSLFAITLDGVEDQYTRDLVELLRRYGLDRIRVTMRDSICAAAPEPFQKEPDEERCTKQYCECIQRIARENHATRIAQGSTVDDQAYEMVTAVLCGKATGSSSPPGAIPYIRPFLAIPEREIILYTQLHTGMGTNQDLRRHRQHDIWAALEDFTSHHPATPFALAHLRETLAQYLNELSLLNRNGPGEDIFPRAEVPGQQKEDQNAV